MEDITQEVHNSFNEQSGQKETREQKKFHLDALTPDLQSVTQNKRPNHNFNSNSGKYYTTNHLHPTSLLEEYSGTNLHNHVDPLLGHQQS
jgi:hypothetical protein